MAERIPLIKLTRASIEFTTVGETAEAVAFTVSGRAAETPRLDSVPIKKFAIFFMAMNFNSCHFTTYYQENEGIKLSFHPDSLRSMIIHPIAKTGLVEYSKIGCLFSLGINGVINKTDKQPFNDSGG
jgi:hypothetical protein